MKQLAWILFGLTAACGGDKAGTIPDGPPSIDSAPPIDTPDAPIDASSCTTSNECPNGYICNAPVCVNIAGSLSGLLWKLPCDASTVTATSCSTVPTSTSSATLAGTTGVTYDVTVRVRGIVEDRTYPNGCKDGYLGTGGPDNAAGDAFNIYKLSISSPAQNYYVNSATSGTATVHSLDYSFSFRADAGATVTLSAASIDNLEIPNTDGAGNAVSVTDATGLNVTQPYNGQFVQLDVTSIVPDAVATNSTVGGGMAGSALTFSTGTFVTVADSASLQPTGFTLEGWFTNTDGDGTYQTMISHTTGAGIDDAFTLWYQQGTIHAGQSSIAHPVVAWTATQDWHHVAVTADATAQKLYIDGQLTACSSGASPTYDAHNTYFGADVENGALAGFWHGSLDELRIFNKPRTSDQIWADMHTHELGATTSLVGEWTFDEGTGQTAADTSTTSNPGQLGATTGTDTSDPAWVTSTVPH
ncbi:MAG TPA: LamG domain-containing protein [Kofleriaceae bacterium]|jgi:hypothetical protein